MPSKRVVDLRKTKPGGHLFDQAPLPLSPQRRVSPVRTRRRRARLIASALVVAIIIALALIASYVSYLPRYSIGQMQVSGAQNVSANAIADYAETIIYDGSHHFFSRANIFLYPKALIEKNIPLEFPRVRSAVVSRPSPLSNAVTITITERQPFAVWCLPAQAGEGTGDCYDMDKDGFIFVATSASASSSAEYVFTGGVSTSTTPIGQTFAPGHAQGLVVFLQLLGQAGLTPEGASVQSDEDFTVPLQEGFSVYASFGQDPGALVSNLQLVLSSSALSGQEQNLEYVDLRFGNKVYYKLKGQSQQTASQ